MSTDDDPSIDQDNCYDRHDLVCGENECAYIHFDWEEGTWFAAKRSLSEPPDIEVDSGICNEFELPPAIDACKLSVEVNDVNGLGGLLLRVGKGFSVGWYEDERCGEFTNDAHDAFLLVEDFFLNRTALAALFRLDIE